MENSRNKNNYNVTNKKGSKRSRHRKNFTILLLLLVVFGLLWNYRNNLFLSEVQPERYISDVTNKPTDKPTDKPIVNPPDETEWSLILVNRWNAIPEEYEVDLTELSNGQSVDTRIYSALQKMFDAARADGIYPVAASGYRTAEKQQILMDEKIAAYMAEGYSASKAKAEAEMWVAIPGKSEHQLGIAVDINADGVKSNGNEVYEWLNQNSYRFGFILRYPPDKTEITGVSSEPWHYRYVGIEAATEMYEQNLCLEEYLEYEY